MEKLNPNKIIPTITVGRYSGSKIDTLPNSYLRWMLTQDFPKLWLDCAKEKLEESDYSDVHLNVTRHAIDMFSKRFIKLWLDGDERTENQVGLGTFLANLAEEAWSKGKNMSKRRHQDDGIVKEYQDIRFVFNVSPEFPEYKDLITVMAPGEKS